jgi:hypothetical protein
MIHLTQYSYGRIILDTATLFSTACRPVPGPIQPPIQWVSGALSPRVKRQQKREADHSPPSSSEVKKNVDLYIHSPIRLHGAVLNKAQGQLYLLVPLTGMD